MKQTLKTTAFKLGVLEQQLTQVRQEVAPGNATLEMSIKQVQAMISNLNAQAELVK